VTKVYIAVTSLRTLRLPFCGTNNKLVYLAKGGHFYCQHAALCMSKFKTNSVRQHIYVNVFMF